MIRENIFSKPLRQEIFVIGNESGLPGLPVMIFRRRDTEFSQSFTEKKQKSRRFLRVYGDACCNLITSKTNHYRNLTVVKNV